jgi:hypothetical protein
MPRAPLVSALILIGACTFAPHIDPLAVRCVLGDPDGCPEGYVCGSDPNVPGRGRCCREGSCPEAPPDGSAPPPDAPQPDAPVLDGPRSDRIDALASDALDALDALDGPMGDCSDPCPPGTKRCGTSLGLHTCRMVDGCWTWSAEEPCPGHMSCDGSGGEPRCQCRLSDCGPMKAPGGLCAVEGVINCAIDSDGCGYMASFDFCPPELPCAGGYPMGGCQCPPVPAACQGGQIGTFCAGGLLGTCGRDVHGCLVVSSQTACPAGKPCTGDFPTANCSCASPAAGCPGVGRVCSSGALATCSVDASGCLVATSRSCGTGRVCTGELSGADCICGDAACRAPQTVGSYADLGGTSPHEGNVLEGVPIDIEVAFVPERFGVIVRQPASDLQIQYALYSSDAAGEPDRAVASTAARVAAGSGDARIEFGVMFPLTRPKKLPSGRYWMMVALDKPSSLAHAAAGTPVPARSVSFQVDWHVDSRVPERLATGLTATTVPAPNYYLVITPQ